MTVRQKNKGSVLPLRILQGPYRTARMSPTKRSFSIAEIVFKGVELKGPWSCHLNF